MLREVWAAFAEVQRIAASGQVLMTARAAEAREWNASGMRRRPTGLRRSKARHRGGRAPIWKRRNGWLIWRRRRTPYALGDCRQSKRAVAGAAAVNPEAEADLLDLAERESLKRTRQEAERRKAEVRSEEEKREREERVREESGSAVLVRERCRQPARHRSGSTCWKELEALIQREVDRKFRANRGSGHSGVAGQLRVRLAHRPRPPHRCWWFRGR